MLKSIASLLRASSIAKQKLLHPINQRDQHFAMIQLSSARRILFSCPVLTYDRARCEKPSPLGKPMQTDNPAPMRVSAGAGFVHGEKQAKKATENEYPRLVIRGY